MKQIAETVHELLKKTEGVGSDPHPQTVAGYLSATSSLQDRYKKESMLTLSIYIQIGLPIILQCRTLFFMVLLAPLLGSY